MKHRYKWWGAYKVFVKEADVNGKSASSIVNISFGANKYVGTWNRTGGYLTAHGMPHGSVSHPLDDTAFAVGALDDTTLYAWGGAAL